MKKLLVVFCMAALLAACGESKNRTSESDAENTEENSGEVATPLEDSTNTMEVDTVSTPTDSIQ